MNVVIVNGDTDISGVNTIVGDDGSGTLSGQNALLVNGQLYLLENLSLMTSDGDEIPKGSSELILTIDPDEIKPNVNEQPEQSTSNKVESINIVKSVKIGDDLTIINYGGLLVISLLALGRKIRNN